MSAARTRRAGFTLVELMIVVLIVGILAAIAVPGFIAQVRRSQMADAYRMLEDIQRAEATYYGLYGQYCAAPWNPASTPAGTTLIGWNSTVPEWRALGLNADGPQRFQYRVQVGAPGAPGPAGVPMPTDDAWFIAQALGDLDADGTAVFVEAYSHGERVYVGRGLDGPYLAEGWE